MFERLFLAVPRGCLRFVIVVFPDHTHLLFFVHTSCYIDKFKLVEFVDLFLVETIAFLFLKKV